MTVKQDVLDQLDELIAEGQMVAGHLVFQAATGLFPGTAPLAHFFAIKIKSTPRASLPTENLCGEIPASTASRSRSPGVL